MIVLGALWQENYKIILEKIIVLRIMYTNDDKIKYQQDNHPVHTSTEVMSDHVSH